MGSNQRLDLGVRQHRSAEHDGPKALTFVVEKRSEVVEPAGGAADER